MVVLDETYASKWWSVSRKGPKGHDMQEGHTPTWEGRLVQPHPIRTQRRRGNTSCQRSCPNGRSKTDLELDGWSRHTHNPIALPREQSEAVESGVTVGRRRWHGWIGLSERFSAPKQQAR